MHKVFLFAMLMMASLRTDAQFEKIGIIGGPSKVMNIHGNNQFFSIGYRLGGMASYRLPGRFSFETGGFFDFHKMPENESLSIALKDDTHYSLDSKREINVGIPLGIMMRTNITRGCVTYLKVSVNPIFNIHQTQLTSSVQSEDLPLETNNAIQSSRSGVQYYSTDLDFGFGTFWHINSAGLQLCVEPKFTMIQHRASITSIQPSEIKLVPSRLLIMSRMGFEVTIYKDLYD